MIVIIANDADTSVLLTPLRMWSAAQLLRPLLVCTAGPEDAQLVAYQVIRGEVIQVRLEEALAADRPNGEQQPLRVTTVVTSLGSGVASAEQVNDVAALAIKELRTIVPPNLWKPPAVVAVPDIPSRRCDPDLFAVTYDPWIIVAAEDRPYDNAANTLIDPTPEQIASHGAHAIVTLSGGWSFKTLGDSFIDHARATGQATKGHVEVVRCYSRIVDTGYFADHVAAQVLRAGTRWPNPDLNAFEDIGIDDDHMQAIANEYARVHARILDVTQLPRIVPKPRLLGFWSALKALAHYIGHRLREQPIRWFEARLGAAYNRVARFLNSITDSNSQQVEGWRPGQEPSLVELFDQLIQYRLVADDGPVGPAWRDLWSLTVGLCDGSDLPADMDLQFLMQARRRVLETDPQRLVPDPEDRPPGARELGGFRPCDPRNLRLDDTAAARPDEEESDQGNDTPAPTEVSWREDRSRSLLWRIGARLAKSAGNAHGEAIRPELPGWQDFDHEARAANDEARKLGDRSLKYVGIGTLCALLVGAVGFYLVPGRWWSWGTLAIVATLWLAATGVYWLAIEGELQRIVGEKTQPFEQLLDKVVLAIVREHDAGRLDRRYEEYLDWTEIIGWFLHRPFAGRRNAELDLAHQADPDTVPEAMGVGVASHDARPFGRLCQGTRNRIFRPSWLHNYYNSVRDQMVREWLTTRGMTSQDDPGLPTGFNDTSRSRSGLRHHLVMATRRGDARHYDNNPVGEELLTHLRRLPLEDATGQVAGLKEGWDQWLAPVQAWTVSDSDLRSEALSLAPAVAQLEVIGAGGERGGATAFVVGISGLLATCRHAIDGSQRIRAKLAGHDWMDATVEHVATDTDLALLQVDADGLPACRVGSAFDLTMGASVFTLGYPKLLEGDPTFSRGEITALRNLVPYQGQQIEVFQTSYRATAGSSGSPVFDAAGWVVGVHLGTPKSGDDERPADFISLAVPANDLSHFLSKVDEGVAPEATVRTGPIASRNRAPSVPPETFLNAVDPAGYGAISPLHFPDGDHNHPDDIIERRLSYDRDHEEPAIALSHLAPQLAFLEPLRLGLTSVERAEPFRASLLRQDDDPGDPETDPGPLL